MDNGFYICYVGKTLVFHNGNEIKLITLSYWEYLRP